VGIDDRRRRAVVLRNFSDSEALAYVHGVLLTEE